MMKKNNIPALLLAFSLLLAGACTEVDVKYPDGGETPPPVDPETESAVVITPSGGVMPSGTKYYFYDADGALVSALPAKADGSLDHKLPFGTYKLLAVDDDAEGIEYRGMNSYATAGVYLTSGSADSRSAAAIMDAPGEVYVLRLNEVVVEEEATAKYTVTPSALTHTLTIDLELSGLTQEVISISGTLNGAYPSASLSTGKPFTAAVENAPATAVQFTAVYGEVTRSGDAGTYPVEIRTLGVLNPGVDAIYTSELSLVVTTADGESFASTSDLTEALSEAANEEGDLPLDIQLAVTIEVEPEPVDPGTESSVLITPNFAGNAVQLTYYFYNSTGEVLTCLSQLDGKLDYKLPFGTYRMLAVSAKEVELSGTTAFNTASAYLKDHTTAVDSKQQPAEVYTFAIDEVVVEQGKDAVYSGTPALLTHTLTLNFDLSAFTDAVTSVTGTFNGIYPGVSLPSGTPSDAAKKAAADTQLYFSSNGGSTALQLPVYSLGILNPDASGATYVAEINVVVTAGGVNTTRTVDITKALADHAAGAESVPSGKQIALTLKPDTTDPDPDPDPVESNPGSNVEDWEEGGSVEGII